MRTELTGEVQPRQWRTCTSWISSAREKVLEEEESGSISHGPENDLEGGKEREKEREDEEQSLFPLPKNFSSFRMQ